MRKHASLPGTPVPSGPAKDRRITRGDRRLGDADGRRSSCAAASWPRSPRSSPRPWRSSPRRPPRPTDRGRRAPARRLGHRRRRHPGPARGGVLRPGARDRRRHHEPAGRRTALNAVNVDLGNDSTCSARTASCARGRGQYATTSATGATASSGAVTDNGAIGVGTGSRLRRDGEPEPAVVPRRRRRAVLSDGRLPSGHWRRRSARAAHGRDDDGLPDRRRGPQPDEPGGRRTRARRSGTTCAPSRAR